MLKSLQTFLIRNNFYINAKKYKQDKRNETKFHMTTGSFIEQYYATSVKLKIPENLYFATFCQNSTQTTKLKSNQTLFDRTDSNLTAFFYQKMLMYFNHLQNHNFTVLWQK